MARNRETQPASDLRLSCVVPGPVSADVQTVVEHLSRLFAADVEQALGGVYPDITSRSNRALLRKVITQRLEQLVVVEESTEARGVPIDAAGTQTLPVGTLTPAEVVQQGKLGMAIASLYRAIDSGRLYCVVPTGLRNGRALPAWQFVSPVPEVLPEVLQVLNRRVQTEKHTFFVTAHDGLNELAPAEVLAGIPFEGHLPLEPSQTRILKLSATERKERVIQLATLEGLD